MGARSSPTLRSKRLARELRKLRGDRTIDQVRAAAKSGWAASTLARWENAERRIRPGDLKILLDVYGVDDDNAERLLTLAREARQLGWWQKDFANVLPPEYSTSTYIGLETEASTLLSYQQQLVAGLLQTEGYARAVIRATRPDDDNAAIEQRVALRMERQHVLEGDNPLRPWIILDEGAARRLVGGPEVMAEQLRWLAEVSERPGVHIQVLPYSAGAHAAMASSFAILRYDGDDPDIVYIDAGTSALFIEEPPEVRAYRLMFDHLRASALSPNESSRLLRALAEELR
ncbi:helix-turn-helix domain-containing protein [Actinocorallia sp. API 0066]|uniref:helix-turn-helix domain-containing protein n=1 Tax=Actinocorallia sp. API 0066 TaxID=2896846 RepID=UPI001E617997|nr:helix-turn-helix transcriptional regulator [Actinocorallia sp. API 0066]MCD0448541.1 helix-turn-helix domain-containing protein [Actinocorallia sp. API 0066]